MKREEGRTKREEGRVKNEEGLSSRARDFIYIIYILPLYRGKVIYISRTREENPFSHRAAAFAARPRMPMNQTIDLRAINHRFTGDKP